MARRALGADAARRRIFQSAGATLHTGRLEETLDGCLAAAAGGGEGLARAICLSEVRSLTP